MSKAVPQTLTAAEETAANSAECYIIAATLGTLQQPLNSDHPILKAVHDSAYSRAAQATAMHPDTDLRTHTAGALRSIVSEAVNEYGGPELPAVRKRASAMANFLTDKLGLHL